MKKQLTLQDLIDLVPVLRHKLKVSPRNVKLIMADGEPVVTASPHLASKNSEADGVVLTISDR